MSSFCVVVVAPVAARVVVGGTRWVSRQQAIALLNELLDGAWPPLNVYCERILVE